MWNTRRKSASESLPKELILIGLLKVWYCIFQKQLETKSIVMRWVTWLSNMWPRLGLPSAFMLQSLFSCLCVKSVESYIWTCFATLVSRASCLFSNNSKYTNNKLYFLANKGWVHSTQGEDVEYKYKALFKLIHSVKSKSGVIITTGIIIRSLIAIGWLSLIWTAWDKKDLCLLDLSGIIV